MSRFEFCNVGIAIDDIQKTGIVDDAGFTLTFDYQGNKESCYAIGHCEDPIGNGVIARKLYELGLIRSIILYICAKYDSTNFNDLIQWIDMAGHELPDKIDNEYNRDKFLYNRRAWNTAYYVMQDADKMQEVARSLCNFFVIQEHNFEPAAKRAKEQMKKAMEIFFNQDERNDDSDETGTKNRDK